MIINNTFRYLILILIMLSANIKLFPQTNKIEGVRSQFNKTDEDTAMLKTYKRLPILNKFRFMPTDVLPDPFINTHFKVDAGSGTAYELKAYIKNFKGEVFDTLTGDLTYISGRVYFQYAFNDWLALSGGYGAYGRIGKNTFTILTSGLSYVTGYTVGAKVRVWHNDKMTLSTNLDYSSGDIYLYSIYDYIKKAVENGLDSISKNNLLNRDNISSGFISGNWAYAPVEWAGFQAVAGFGFGETFNEKTRGNLRLGGAASVDFNNISIFKTFRIPVGFLVSARYNKFSETGENVDNIITFGIKLAYTGHKDFDLGIESTYQNLNFKRIDEKIKTVLYSFKVRYYF